MMEYEDTSKAARVNNNVLKDSIVVKTKARWGKKLKMVWSLKFYNIIASMVLLGTIVKNVLH